MRTIRKVMHELNESYKMFKFESFIVAGLVVFAAIAAVEAYWPGVFVWRH